MNRIANIGIAALTLTAALALSGCTYGSAGIFAGLEDEQKITDTGGLNKNATITSMAEDATRYLAAGGTYLYQRAKTDTTWTKSLIPSTGTLGTDSVYSVRSIGASALYAIAGTGTSNKLYHLTATSPDVWTEVTLASGNPVDLVPVIGSDGHSVVKLVVVTTVTTNSKLDYKTVYLLNDDTAATQTVDLDTSLSSPVSAAAWDGTNLYLVNKSFLWKTDAALASPALVSVASGPSGLDYSSILIVSGTTNLDGFYLATFRNGSTGAALYRGTVSGNTWTSAKTLGTNSKLSSTPLDILSLLLPDTSSTCVLAATSAAGYAEATSTALALTPTLTTKTGNYDSSVLTTAWISLFYVDTTGTLFLGTNAQGLWTHDATTKEWSLE